MIGRPNFFAWCNPDWGNIECGDETHPNLVTDYTCMGTSNENFAGKEKESKMSFVSGHASLSCQAATFVILYLQVKFVSTNEPRRFYLAIPFFQVVSAICAYFTCLSRVMDYQHHPGDVIGKTVYMLWIKISLNYYAI